MNSYHDLTELKDLIVSQMTPDQLLDLLGLDLEDLVERLHDDIESNKEEIERVLRNR